MERSPGWSDGIIRALEINRCLKVQLDFSWLSEPRRVLRQPKPTETALLKSVRIAVLTVFCNGLLAARSQATWCSTLDNCSESASSREKTLLHTSESRMQLSKPRNFTVLTRSFYNSDPFDAV